jgi:hypothetical protein
VSVDLLCLVGADGDGDLLLREGVVSEHDESLLTTIPDQCNLDCPTSSGCDVHEVRHKAHDGRCSAKATLA